MILKADQTKTLASNCIINPCIHRFGSTCRAAQVVPEAACQRRASADPAKIPYHSSLFREPPNRWQGLCVLFTGSVCTLSHLERTPQKSGPFHSVHSAKCFLPLPLVPTIINILKLIRSRLDPGVHLRRRVETSRHHWTSRILLRFLIVGSAINVYRFQHCPIIRLYYTLLSPRHPSMSRLSSCAGSPLPPGESRSWLAGGALLGRAISDSAKFGCPIPPKDRKASMS